MFEYLALTDGTTLIDLTSDPYALVSYTATPSALADSELANEGPYTAVEDTLIFHVSGCTAAEAYANVNAVTALLDQAWRWRRGENVTAVIIRAQAQGSTTHYDAVLKGRSIGSPSPVVQPPTWDESAQRYLVRNVTLRSLRRGQWLKTTETAASAGAANPSILTATLPSTLTTKSPIDVRIAVFGTQTTPFTLADMFVLIAPNAAALLIQEAEAMTAANYTSVADAGNNARGGNVLRYTPVATTLATSGFSGSLAALSGKTIGVYAAVRNNSATTTWQVDLLVYFAGGTTRTTPIVIDTSTTNPRVVALGIVTIPTQAVLAQLEITASAASGTLDIDYLVFLDLDDETSRAVFLPAQTVQATGLITTSLGISIESQVLTQITPRVITKDGTGGTPGYLAYESDIWLMSDGATVCAVVMATAGPSGAGSWRYTNGGVVNNTLNVTRYPAAMLPQ